MSPSPLATYLLFAIGLLLLTSLVTSFRRIRHFRLALKRAESDVCFLLNQRAAALRDFQWENRAAGEEYRQMRNAFLQQQNARTQEERFRAEQEISNRLLTLTPVAANQGSASVWASLLGESVTVAREMEPMIASAREAYNEAAAVWNQSINEFPAGILIRAMGWSLAPLFHPTDIS